MNRVLIFVFLSVYCIRAGNTQPKQLSPHQECTNAIIGGDLARLEAIISRPDFNINGADKDGWTPLRAACVWNQPAAIGLLLAHDAKPLRVDPRWASWIFVALQGNSDAEIDNKRMNTTLHCLLKNYRNAPGVISDQRPDDQKLLERLKEKGLGERYLQFCKDSIEQVEDAERATIAEVVLSSHRIFPSHSVIDGTILAYVSAYQETSEERAQTLQVLNPHCL